MNLLRRWREDRSGATAVEYGMIVAVLVLVVVGGIGNTYNAIQHLFEDNNNRLVQTIK